MDTFGGTFGTLIYLAFVVLLIIGQWTVNEKGGFPGWYAIIPILNVYALFKIAGKPGWWIILLFAPFVNFVVWVLAMLDLAKAFARSQLFGIGLAFLSGIFPMIIGFGEDQYQGAPN
jgi:Family of unknown function (DUF5684)